ncbi:MAG: class I SAM-dependent methyltransferase [Chromatiales bacterium]|jgi:SAM-dependent methyltransferase|nr:class I SAM-dependent methyltransferase [Chromatiales bacterium]
MDQTERLLEPLTEALYAAATVVAGEAVLDVGCGGGATSRELARRAGPARRVTGVDVSAPILAVARERSRDLPNLVFETADAADAAAPVRRHDVLVSRFGVMFFADPVAAFANLRHWLVPGGRVAFLCWQSLDRNPWMAVPAGAAFRIVPAPPPPEPGAPGPFAFADADRTLGILERAGFRTPQAVPVRAGMRWADAATALDYVMEMGVLGRALQDQPDAVRSRVREAVGGVLAERTGGDGAVVLDCAAWLVTASA